MNKRGITITILAVMLVTMTAARVMVSSSDCNDTPLTPVVTNDTRAPAESVEQPASMGRITLSAQSDFEISTDDGLTVRLSQSGHMTGLTIDGIDLTVSDIPPVTVYDRNRNQTAQLLGSVRQVGNTVQQTSTVLDLFVNATHVPHAQYIEVLFEGE
ncbi:MAG: hypothetical protein HXY34_06285 [Candidatus Thorarchaeota archaeon]|nr:hypothetical protein [Candidatus Thorarchaeota archaeon]